MTPFLPTTIENLNVLSCEAVRRHGQEVVEERVVCRDVDGVVHMEAPYALVSFLVVLLHVAVVLENRALQLLHRRRQIKLVVVVAAVL